MLQFVEKSVDTYVQILADTSKNDEVVDVFGYCLLYLFCIKTYYCIFKD